MQLGRFIRFVEAWKINLAHVITQPWQAWQGPPGNSGAWWGGEPLVRCLHATLDGSRHHMDCIMLLRFAQGKAVEYLFPVQPVYMITFPIEFNMIG